MVAFLHATFPGGLDVPWTLTVDLSGDNPTEGGDVDAAHKSLRWVCLGCGQNWKIEMPGFPGSTIGGYHWHVFDQARGVNCSGPLIAVIAKDATDAGC